MGSPAMNGLKFRGFAVASLSSQTDVDFCLTKDRLPQPDTRPLYVSKYTKADETAPDNNSGQPRVFKYEMGEEVKKIYVSGLKTENSRNLQNLKSLFTNSTDIRIPTNKSGSENKPYAYIEFSSADEAKKAVEEFDGKE